MKSAQFKTDDKHRHQTWNPFFLSCLMLVAAVASTGCKPQAKVAADTNIAGTYMLASVDGKQVPCTISHEGASPTIKSGAFVINANGTCSSKMTFSMGSGPEANREVKASYTRDGSRLTMKWERAGVAGDTFTMNNEGMVLAYRR